MEDGINLAFQGLSLSGLLFSLDASKIKIILKKKVI
jgi:hypothetical protein